MIDTGGIEFKTNDDMFKNMRIQTELAIETADVILFIVDGKSLVVPAISLTIDLLYPNNLFINEDFPTLGLPTKAILIISSSLSSKSLSSKCLTTSSSIFYL